jgi:opacity protein-like surface antigen
VTVLLQSFNLSRLHRPFADFPQAVTQMCKGSILEPKIPSPMKKPFTLPALALVTLALLVTSLSTPAAADDGGVFVSANLGVTLSTYSRNDLNDALIATDNGELTVRSSSLDKPKAPWWADVGYMFSPYVGVTASYLDLQTLKYQATGTQTPPVGSDSPVSAKVDITSRGPTLAVLGVLPVWNAWQVTGRAGIYLGKTSTNYSSTVGTDSNSGSESTTGASLLLGIGGSYSLSQHCALRLDYLYVNGVHETALDKSFNVSLLTAGIMYAF